MEAMGRLPLILRRATKANIDDIIGLIEERAKWLEEQNKDQWRRPWPNRAARDGRILAGLRADKTWICWDNGTAAATITADPEPNMAWPDTFRDEPAIYVHRLVVGLEYAHRDLGGRLLDWAGWNGWRDHGAVWVRLTAWTTNFELHAYYRKQRFDFCGRHPDDGYPSGVMFQKPTELAKPPDPGLFLEDPPRYG